MDRDAQQREIEKNETILARQNDDLTLTEHARAKTRADIEALTAELKDEENPMTGDQRYSHRMTIQEKENLLKEGKEDLDRRRTQVEKRHVGGKMSRRYFGLPWPLQTSFQTKIDFSGATKYVRRGYI